MEKSRGKSRREKHRNGRNQTVSTTSSFMTAEERWNAIRSKISRPSAEPSKSRTEKILKMKNKYY